jgi:hypothetical protein
MTTLSLRALLLPAILILLAGSVLAAPKKAMADHELDAVYAAGFEVRIDVDLDVAATNPDALLFIPGGDSAAFGQFVSRGMDIAHSGRSREPGTFDPNGTYMPNLQNLTMNNISLGDGALQNASTLLNVFALQGDVAVGVNLNVIVNPTNSNINLTQMNVNWSTIGSLPGG